MMDHAEIHARHYDPPPAIVQSFMKRDVRLSYTSHATVTAILNAIDPDWQLLPGWADPFDGIWPPGCEPYPSNAYITNDRGRQTPAVFQARLVLLGKVRLCVGNITSDKGSDAYKELVGDAIRNGAMRHGIHLALWERDDSVSDALAASEPEAEPAEARSEPAAVKPARAQPGTAATATERRNALNRLIAEAPEAEQRKAIIASTLAHFDVGSIQRIPLDRLDEATEFVNDLLAGLPKSDPEVKGEGRPGDDLDPYA